MPEKKFEPPQAVVSHAPLPDIPDLANFAVPARPIYAVQPNGDLLWYRHVGVNDGRKRWADGSGKKIGNGWGHFLHVFGGTDGIIYAVQPNGDLLWYKHLGARDGTPPWADGNGKQLAKGWGFPHVFGGTDGIIYAVQPNGDLLWYKHVGVHDGTPVWTDSRGKKVGNGWGHFLHVFGGTDGIIYAVQPNGDLLWYKHLGAQDGTPRWTDGSGKKVGNGWGHFIHLSGSKNRAKRAPASKLQWRVRWWREYESDDSGLQGATDETAVQASGFETSMTVVAGADGGPALELVRGGHIPDLLARRDRRPDLLPQVLLEFDVSQPALWPRTFIVILQFVERDNADLARLYATIEREYGNKIDELLGKAGVVIGGAVGGLILGAEGKEAGEQLGVYLGEALKEAHRLSVPLILQGWSDDIFPPVVLQLTVNDPAELTPMGATSGIRTLDLRWPGSDAHYGLDYDWNAL